MGKTNINDCCEERKINDMKKKTSNKPNGLVVVRKNTKDHQLIMIKRKLLKGKGII
jgi:hypothetical protein